jgi:hypothetical protein
MPVVEQLPFLAVSVQDAVSTSAASESPMTRDYGRLDTGSVSWDAVESQLIEWGCDGGRPDEDDIEPASKDTIQRAIRVAAELSREANPAPTRVVADAHGGIVFELQAGKSLESIHIHASGDIEHRVFRSHRLVLREKWLL